MDGLTPEDWREFWIPGERIRGGEPLLDHVVIATLFTGEGNAGVVWSQHANNNTDHVVWNVSRRGEPRPHTFHSGAEAARLGFRQRVAEALAGD